MRARPARPSTPNSRTDDPKPTAKAGCSHKSCKSGLRPQSPRFGILVFRANAGDVEGVVALYEPDAALACGDGRIAGGTAAIRRFYAGLLAAGRTFDFGEQRPAMLRENLALTSTRLPNGIVTAEVARKPSISV
jgi:hypothetical protein